ncbi:hypothetical protein H5P28_01905 [Ruficoccus amylovorans]|uniref:DUF3352 domain-containing protein n=1 Tax=Ruficoccus amylovorans TaxID=1804625 RepID=A0A842H9P6_9BACT|nr:hypothetical protein [Ruficoccus amylovorans]MBC2593005.1 hypothetical protein [Ruficoccus amylovorans]
MFSLNFLSRTRPAFLMLLLGTLALGAQSAPKPFGVLRLPPLPSLPEKINAFGYATDTNQTLQFLTLFTLGQIGYPTFPGASRTENSGLVGFETGLPGDIAYALVTKFSAGSSVPAKIQQVGGMAVKEVGGWTVIAPDQASLHYVNANNIEGILQLVRKKRVFDFEFEVTRSREDMQRMRQSLSGSKAGSDQQGLALALAFMENVQSSLFGINLDTERFQVGTRQVAWPDTPEAALLSAPAGGEVSVARFVPATGNAGVIYHVDPVAVSDYLKVFFQRMEATGEQPEAAQLHDKLEQTLNTIAKDWDGTGAYRLEFQPEQVDYAGVVGGDWEQEPFSQLLDELFSDIMPALLEEIPVQQYASAVQMATSTTKAAGPISSALPGAVGNVVAGGSLNTLDQYEPPTHQIVDGMIVISNQPERLEELAAAVAADRAADDPLSDHLSLKDGQALRAYVDLKSVYMQSLRQMNLPASPSTTLVLSNLAATPLEPMTIEVDTGNNTMTALLTLPVETVRILSGTLQQLKQSSSEQRMH